MFLKNKLGHMHIDWTWEKNKKGTEHEHDDSLNLKGF